LGKSLLKRSDQNGSNTTDQRFAQQPCRHSGTILVSITSDRSQNNVRMKTRLVSSQCLQPRGKKHACRSRVFCNAELRQSSIAHHDTMLIRSRQSVLIWIDTLACCIHELFQENQLPRVARMSSDETPFDMICTPPRGARLKEYQLHK
jgi:hypothetical protein